jgi:phenylpyruvate tautomerase PptA (4-oxalocrotonate tautomerase family)
MPRMLIEVRRQYTPGEESALIDAAHRGLREGFKIPEWDRNVRLVAHAPHRFECSPRVPQPDRYTQITIDCFKGRSIDAKRRLYRAVVANLEALGIPASCVQILLNESALENWGVAGGKPACDVDLGFKVDV